MPAMNVKELMEDEGYTREQAEKIMLKRTFGDDVTLNRDGTVEERGIGSPWSIKNHPELNRNHFAGILKEEGLDAHAAALAKAGLKQAP